MSAENRHGEGPRRAGARRQGQTSQHFGVGGEPLPLVGGLRGLGKIGVAVVALVIATAVIAAVVALLY